MRRSRIQRSLPAIGLGLALSLPATAFGQGVSSGSGAGTGTGQSAGSLGTTGTGRESMPGAIGRPGRLSRPGDLTRPVDLPGIAVEPSPGSMVKPEYFQDARSVADPGERALALIRISQTAIFSRQLQEAHDALFDAAPAALSEPDPLIRQQRLGAIIDNLLRLAEERMTENSDVSDAPPDLGQPAPGTPAQSVSPSPGLPATEPRPAQASPPPALPDADRQARLRAALPEWAKSVELATRIESSTARTEALFRIVESEAFSSQRLITDPLRLRGLRPDPANLPAEIRSYTDNLLALASRHANMIERPIWRNFATFSIVSNAAASSQFPRGFQIARAIDQPEARTNALIRLAEGQALNARPNDATAAYAEAARSVSQIPQDDPRETLVGVLIDSLISFGRFDDARACVTLYATDARRIVALSAVAESQGRRGLSESARIWIGRDAPPAFRPQLYRKVNDGILASIEQNRSKELSNRSQ